MLKRKRRERRRSYEFYKKNRAHVTGRMNRRWTVKELDLVLNAEITDVALGRKINRSVMAIYKARERLKSGEYQIRNGNVIKRG